MQIQTQNCPCPCHEIHSFLTSATDGDEWSASRFGRFNHKKRVTGTRAIGCWMRPRADLHVLEERKLPWLFQESNHDSSLSCSVRRKVQQGKEVGTWSYHSGAFSSEVKNSWSCTSTHSYALMLCRETKFYLYLYKGIVCRESKICICFCNFLLDIHSFIHSFIYLRSVNPYKVSQPIGYRTCHNINVS